MSKWTKGWCSHERQAGIFELNVWPLEASTKHPYSCWAVIPDDGNSRTLPSSTRAKVKFSSLDEAKTWIEDAVRQMCQTTIDALKAEAGPR